jgi:uncharacterized protein (DUF1810 family)
VTTHDPFDLSRFVEAQRENYADAIAELRAGRKRTHWSWYVFPQLRGLGSSPVSMRYAISGLEEAKAYLEHPLLGPRLVECIEAMNRHAAEGPEAVLGQIDARKFHSCVTLFSRVPSANKVFAEALALHFAGQPDTLTTSLLAHTSARGGA